jgi:hypothetical protein
VKPVTCSFHSGPSSWGLGRLFIGPLSSAIHTVEVKAQALIECRGNVGDVIPCPTGTLAGYTNASTQAAIGKATVLIEEQQNWGAQ